MIDRKFYQKMVASYLTREAGKDYTILFLTFLSLLLFGFWGVRSLLLNIAAFHSELKSGGTYEAALAEKIAALDQGKANLAQISNKMEAINNAIPDDPAQAELIEELTIDGGKTGFSLTNIFFKEREREKGINPESFECSFEGSSKELIRFLEEIAKGRLMMIESLGYSPMTTEAGGILTVTLKGKSFHYEEGRNND